MCVVIHIYIYSLARTHVYLLPILAPFLKDKIREVTAETLVISLKPSLTRYDLKLALLQIAHAALIAAQQSAAPAAAAAVNNISASTTTKEVKILSPTIKQLSAQQSTLDLLGASPARSKPQNITSTTPQQQQQHVPSHIIVTSHYIMKTNQCILVYLSNI